MNGRSLSKGLIVVLLGLILLANNFRILGWDVWYELFRLWPVILIAIGTHFIFRRSSVSFLQILPPLIIIAAIGGAIYLSHFDGKHQEADQVFTFEQPLSPDLMRANIKISFGSGTLRLEGDSTYLFDGDLTIPSWLTPKMRYEVIDREGFLELTEERGKDRLRFGPWRKNHFWNLRLNSQVPLALTIKTGASSNYLDLSSLKVTYLELDAGASRNELKFGDSVSVKAKIRAGVSRIELLIPQSMGTRIKADTALSSSNLMELGFGREKDMYTSKNYPTAETRVDLDLDVGVSSVRVELY